MLHVHMLNLLGLLILPVIDALPNTDTCVVSLTIPKDSIKSSCNIQDGILRKMQSMEAQLNRMHGRVQAVEMRLPQIVSRCSSTQDKVNSLEVNLAKEATKFGSMEQKISALESMMQDTNEIGRDQSAGNHYPVLQPDTFLDPVRPYLASELQKIKEEIMNSVLKQIMLKLSEQTEEVGSSAETEELNSEVDTEISNGLVNHTEELTIPVKPPNLDLLARSIKNLHLNNLTDQERTTVSESVNSTTDKSLEKSMYTIRKVIESTADILREEMRETVLQMKENDMALVVSNMSEVMSKVKDLEIQYETNHEGIKVLLKNHSAVISGVKNDLINLENHIDGVERKIDGPLNDIFAESRLQHKFNAMETNIQSTITDQFHAITRPWENRIEQQDRKINMSTTFINIFREALNTNFNNSQVKLREIETNIQILQSNVTNLKTSSFQQQPGNSDCQQQIERLDTQVQDILATYFFFETGYTQFKDSSNKADRDIKNKLHEINLKMVKLQQDLTATTKLANKTEILEAEQGRFIDRLQAIHGDLHLLKKKLIIDTGGWLQHNFSHSVARVSCNNGQYIKKNTKYENVAKYVGVVLCSPTKYKIFLGNSVDGEFLDVADKMGYGEDHCEYVGADSASSVIVDKSIGYPGPIDGKSMKNLHLNNLTNQFDIRK